MLRLIELPDLFDAPPPERAAAELIAEADRRIERFQYHRHGPIIDNFVACDFTAVDAHLRWIVENQLLTGQSFCEWGCGFGVVTLLAALRDFDACGIEVEGELVDEARRLAEDFDIPTQFAHGSLIPDGGHELVEYVEDIAHIETDSPSGYDELGLGIDDFDLFFAFPWPGEYAFWELLFDEFAADGALMLTYRGMEDLRLHRRIRKR